MLNQLDTLIGFVVVMALVSLMITIITQMVSSVLGLRGRCLADALEVMIFKIDKSIDKETCTTLIHELLTHPAVSDSVLSMNKPVLLFWKWNPDWWNWLVTQWKRTSAIRPDELLALLKEFADGSGRDTGDAAKNSDLKQAAVQILGELNKIPAGRLEALRAVRTALPKLAETEGAAVVQELAAASNHALNNLETWFNSAQDRAKQWFGMHTRVVTVAASFCMAFVLQLDTIALLQQVSADKQLRDNLVKSAVDGSLAKLESQVIDTNNVVYQQSLPVLTNTLSNVVQTAGKDGLQLLPQPYPYPFRFAGWKWRFIEPTGRCWSWPLHHLLGIIISAGLLSLGAPFWFNILKSLVNLRSSLANQIDNNPKQTPKQPSA